MSAATFDSIAAPPAASLPQSERVDFDYKPIPVSAPVSMVLGLCSLVAFLPAVGVIGFLIATAGFVTAVTAWRTIRRHDGAGLWMAALGGLLSLTGLAGGAAYHSVAYATELPPDHTRLDFTADIAQRALAPTGTYSESIKRLDGEKVFLKGYMYPEAKTEDITSFIFVKDSGDCCFGGKPKVTDMIRVDMTGDTTDFTTGLVSVAGTFELRPEGGTKDVDPIFRIKATQSGPASTSF
ncbi:hypothetical protein [Alienimonas californiensis]|uniref:DUF4190 domain-containing protein n=1 Tax=Alienimonas californiensis TaxID=2527989 RepID=A0A517PCA7_9PLAN|nr:hypothetical protein [Alienimonas californiensis]QDT17005.1 hypothetical protein CA12_31150 [Alienimonas californiensis]